MIYTDRLTAFVCFLY